MKICFGTTLKHLIIPIQLGVFSLLFLSFFLFGGVAKAEQAIFAYENPYQNTTLWHSEGTLFNSGVIPNVTSIDLMVTSNNFSNGIAKVIFKKLNTCEIVGETEELTLDSDYTIWQNFTFANGGLELEPNTDYIFYPVVTSGLSNFRTGIGSGDYGTYYKSDCSYKEQYESIAFQLYYDDEWTPPPTNCSPGYTLINNNCILTNNLNSLNLPFSILSPYNCYNESTCKVNYFYDENKITIYDTIDIYKYDSPTSTEKTLIHDDLSIIDYNAFGKRNGESYFTLTGTSTTTGFEYYEMIGNKAEYWDRETLETVPATTTTPYLIVINWINTEIPTIEEIIANINTSTTTASTIWDINSYELACTDEEWNSTSTYLGLNLTTTLCQIKKLGFDMMLTTGEFAKSQGEKLGKFIGNIFPFGFMKQINNSWKNSKNETITSENFFFKNFEENGEISLTLPETINGTSSSTKIYIWGQTAWGEDVQEIINAIRWLSTYLLWLSFIYGIYETGKNIYEEIKE